MGCGDERIMIFTTNHKDKLDAALIRPGRMDFHIHTSYCTPCGFPQLKLLKNDGPDIVSEGLVEFFDVKRKENEEAKAKAKKMKEEKEELATKITKLKNEESG
uniref:ATPase AAA-type core domain-containing protein n=1 Tax=Lactuca sativa TaxID=4236 RepID=A0A9R1W9I3_LACSA|nr:hypothetical protein LSAT_V11C200078340 [Lactuca sativa]